jgi:hypothetical protein
VDYLYSLYDALVSINVPSDKARAVVDAMERDMGTTLATKQDLEHHRLVTKQDLEFTRLATKQDLEVLKLDLASLRRDLENRIEGLERDLEGRFALVGQRFVSLEARLKDQIDTQTLRMTVRFGLMLFAGLGLALGVVRLWT